MAQDIRDLFKNEDLKHEDMPKNHEARFLEKLENTLPETQKTPKSNWFNMAASALLLIGLSVGAYKFITPINNSTKTIATTKDTFKAKTLGDVSPDLKKVEDYYLASINLELSKMKPTAKTKVVFDGYLEQLEELNKEYKRLSLELNENTSELTINALIDNLRFRLNLLYRLKDQLQTLNASDEAIDANPSI